MQLSLKRQLAEGKGDLEKTYRYAVHEIEKSPRKISKSSH